MKKVALEPTENKSYPKIKGASDLMNRIQGQGSDFTASSPVASPNERILLMSTKTERIQTKMHPLDKCRAYKNQITFTRHVWKFYKIHV